MDSTDRSKENRKGPILMFSRVKGEMEGSRRFKHLKTLAQQNYLDDVAEDGSENVGSDDEYVRCVPARF